MTRAPALIDSTISIVLSVLAVACTVQPVPEPPNDHAVGEEDCVNAGRRYDLEVASSALALAEGDFDYAIAEAAAAAELASQLRERCSDSTILLLDGIDLQLATLRGHAESLTFPANSAMPLLDSVDSSSTTLMDDAELSTFPLAIEPLISSIVVSEPRLHQAFVRAHCTEPANLSNVLALLATTRLDVELCYQMRGHSVARLRIEPAGLCMSDYYEVVIREYSCDHVKINRRCHVSFRVTKHRAEDGVRLADDAGAAGLLRRLKKLCSWSH